MSENEEKLLKSTAAFDFAPVAKVCKYGHGPLQKKPGAWSLRGTKAGAEQLGLLSSTADLLFVVEIHACPTCGYLEFFDF